VAVSGKRVRRSHGRNLRRAIIRRSSRRSFVATIRMRTSKGRTVVVRRRVAAC
jgi:hypothetical protein